MNEPLLSPIQPDDIELGMPVKSQDLDKLKGTYKKEAKTHEVYGSINADLYNPDNLVVVFAANECMDYLGKDMKNNMYMFRSAKFKDIIGFREDQIDDQSPWIRIHTITKATETNSGVCIVSGGKRKSIKYRKSRKSRKSRKYKKSKKSRRKYT